MEIPSILQGDVHLPLKEGMMSNEAIALSNSFYDTALRPEDFRETQVFQTDTGIYNLELIEEATGEVKVLFVNKNMNPVVAPVTWEMQNPLTRWVAAPVTVGHAEELGFLDALDAGDHSSVTGGDGNLSYQLAQLLNDYRVAGRWVSGTLGQYAAGGFQLVYKGSGKEAPAEFGMDSDYIVVVLITNGSTRGYVCLRV